MRTMQILLTLTAAVALAASPAAGQLENPIPEPILPGEITVGLEPVAGGLTSPVWLTHAGDGSGRTFILEQDGLVRILGGDGTLREEPFLDVSDRLVDLRPNFDERGLLGLAFHPGFEDPTSPGYRRLYTYTSEPAAAPADFTVPVPGEFSFDHQAVIAEWQVAPGNPDQVAVDTRREILRIDEPQFNHNGGTLLFDEGGNLYISLGDGGAADDQGLGHVPGGNGQAPGNILGNILRIDPLGTDGVNGAYGIPDNNPFVDDPEALDEIYAYGFRNPYRMSFDRGTGRLFVGDAGQNDIEEVDIVAAGGNFGWRLKEGSFNFNPNGDEPGFVTADTSGLPEDLIDPVLEYDHDEGLVVIGGFVYRGSAVPELVGRYVFGDFQQPGTQTGRLFVGDPDTGEIAELRIAGRDALGHFILGFGEDAAGELYVLTSDTRGPTGDSDVVYRIIPEPASLSLLGLAGAATLLRRRKR